MTTLDRPAPTRERCDECGFDAGVWSRAGAIEELRALPDEWRATFAAHDPAILRARPAPETWSALEYAVHTGHIVRLWHEAVLTFVAGGAAVFDAARYPDADRDPYNDTPVDVALADVTAQLHGMALLATSLTEDGWTAPVRLSDPDMEEGYRRYGLGDVQAGILHALHDALHHYDDIRRGLGQLTGSAPVVLP